MTWKRGLVAPVVDTYTEPEILSGRASGVSFHEICGHRVEGRRTAAAEFRRRPDLQAENRPAGSRQVESNPRETTLRFGLLRLYRRFGQTCGTVICHAKVGIYCS